MICKLCLEDKPLLKKSHIIPRFMFDGLFDKDHKIVEINSQNIENPKLMSDAHYDKDILCAECDNDVIGAFESYASKALFGKGNPGKDKVPTITHENNDGLVSLIFNNLDYTKTKLFLLSILWRAHISSNSFFEEIDLGTYAERIRQMIYHNNAGLDDELETCLLAFSPDCPMPVESVIAPRQMKKNGNCFYSFFINGIMYCYNLSQYNKQTIFDSGAITSSHTMNIGILHGEIAEDIFDRFLGRPLRFKSKMNLK